MKAIARLFLVFALLAVGAVAVAQPVAKDCSVACTVVSDATTDPTVTACTLYEGTLGQMVTAPLVDGGCWFQVAIPLGQTRTYTARFRNAAGLEGPDSAPPVALTSRVVAPPTVAPPYDLKLVAEIGSAPMAQAIVQSGNGQFGGSSATVVVALPAVTAGNALMVMYGGWNNLAVPQVSVDDAGLSTWQLAARADYSAGGNTSTSVHYADNVSAGPHTVTVTHPGASPNRFGWVWVGEVSGRATVSSLDTAATGFDTQTTTTPTVTGAGSTTQATAMIVAATECNVNSNNAGIDPASGGGLVWNNLLLKQDAAAEAAVSFDYALVNALLVPTISWGTITASVGCTMVIVAFKDGAAAVSSAPLLGQACL